MLLACAATWATYPVIMRALYAAPGPTLNAAPTFVVALRFLATAVMQALVQGILTHRRKSRAAPSDAGAREAGTPSGGVSSSSGGGGIAHAPRSQTLVMASAVPADEARSIQRRMRGAAVELGVIGLCGNFLSVSGIAHLPAMLAEVFLGTVHIFVPLCSVALGGAAAVGARTWAACALSFAAVCVAGLGGAVASGGLSSAAAAIGGASASYIGGIFSMIGAALLYSLARVRTSHHLRSGLDAQALNRRRYQAISGLAVAALLVDALVSPARRLAPDARLAPPDLADAVAAARGKLHPLRRPRLKPPVRGAEGRARRERAAALRPPAALRLPMVLALP